MYDIALVGAGGFLGGAIHSTLIAHGHRVTSYTRSEPVLVDGVLAPAAASADVVVWAAGGISPMIAEQHPELVQAELEYFRAVVEAVDMEGDPNRFVFLASGGTAYGAPDVPPYTESAGTNPSNRYGEFKIAQENILAGSGLAGTSLRIANAYGPGQRGARGQGVLAIWMQAILAGEPVRIHGSGAVARDYVYVDDVAHAVERIVALGPDNDVVNVGSGTPTTLDDMLATLSAVVGPDRVVVERLPSRGVDSASTWLDVSLAERSIGWRATIPIIEGVARMWHWTSHQ